jgi:hypothetical protein
MNVDVTRETLAYQEKVSLAELEEAKAHQRVLELKYELARFQLEAFLSLMRAAEQKQKGDATQIPSPPSS